MARITLEVTMMNIYSFEAPAYGYGYETRYIYTMQDQEGKQYVWKTTAYMGYETEAEDGWIIKGEKKLAFIAINKGDVIKIAATIKSEGEYKGVPQTELTRVKVIERTFKAKTPEEIRAEKEAEAKAKKQEQLDSIQGGDFAWTMPYKQYKEHYSDCETVTGSFERHQNRPATITVIIREGRLKASGVRGEHYSGYEFKFTEDGKEWTITYRAVKEENALKRLMKDFPEASDIKPGRIYNYR